MQETPSCTASQILIKTLGDIVSIRSGYPFRERITPASNGTHRIIQIKDIGPDATFDVSELVRVDSIEAGPAHLVREGDVLFIARGTRRQAVALTELPGPTIATGQFFVLTPQVGLVPKYLAWYINQRPAQKYLDENVTGSNLPMIGKGALATLPVRLPPIETQHLIVEIDRLNRREQELIEMIGRTRQLLVEAWALKAIERD